MDVTVSEAVLDEALAALGLHDVWRSPGTRRLVFGPWPDAPAFVVHLAVEREAGVVSLRLAPFVTFPWEYRPELLSAVNAWHQRYRWPRWSVADGDGVTGVIGDLHIPCRHGLLADQLADTIRVVVDAGRNFWSRLHDPEDPPAGLLRGLGELLDLPDKLDPGSEI